MRRIPANPQPGGRAADSDDGAWRLVGKHDSSYLGDDFDLVHIPVAGILRQTAALISMLTIAGDLPLCSAKPTFADTRQAPREHLTKDMHIADLDSPQF